MKLFIILLSMAFTFLANAENIYRSGDSLNGLDSYLVSAEDSVIVSNITNVLSTTRIMIFEEDGQILARVSQFEILVDTIDLNSNGDNLTYQGEVIGGPFDGEDALISLSKTNGAFVNIADRVKFDSLDNEVSLPVLNN